jgi:hypothetical protein
MALSGVFSGPEPSDWQPELKARFSSSDCTYLPSGGDVEISVCDGEAACEDNGECRKIILAGNEG